MALYVLQQVYWTLYNETPSEYLQGHEEREDFGGFMVSKSLLLPLDIGAAKTATVYARELLRVVFRREELVGKSITGKQTNAQENKAAKAHLDRIRVIAVISEPQFSVGRLQHRSSAIMFSAFKEMVAGVGLLAAKPGSRGQRPTACCACTPGLWHYGS
ncbi:hypothetical protein HPB47_003511 [Ixodes persulcatus]|uniref:Uncharacterized protein n=1 Tax=Ixodes persulcatus TaxID=34615 RepID=A0AC60PI57_IXOPE|nr:hypothetical protein HPB47_003511 [Ixodes persulcatus]